MKSQLAGEVVVRVKMTQAGHLQFVASNQHGFRLFSRHRIDASGPGWPCGSKTGGLANPIGCSSQPTYVKEKGLTYGPP
jgi:hypothetical protein